MAEKLTHYDPAEDLVSDEAIAQFMTEAFETQDAAYIAHALGVIARCQRHGPDRCPNRTIPRATLSFLQRRWKSHPENNPSRYEGDGHPVNGKDQHRRVTQPRPSFESSSHIDPGDIRRALEARPKQ